MADTSHWFLRRRGSRWRSSRQRQLPRRHHLAADRAALHRDRGLARDACRRSASFCLVGMLPLVLVLRRRAPREEVATQPRRCERGRRQFAGTTASDCRPRALQSLSDHRRRSPAAWRCRCRRSTSSRTAATSATAPRVARDAVADARLRHRQPAGFGMDRRSHRRAAHAVARLGAAGRGAAAVTCPSTGWLRCT